MIQTFIQSGRSFSGGHLNGTERFYLPMERNIIILFTRENGGNTASFSQDQLHRTESCEVIWASVLFSPF
ncbi:hypothetical protein [Bacillus velezensis]|uniref:hypothetical protein n=1 Tax=Bacillus velezensis TaxID=492670 RepID=UPI001E3C6E19|nr:hypothetical protein [Bacillus velezensis]